jgi:hypothetical protein
MLTPVTDADAGNDKMRAVAGMRASGGVAVAAVTVAVIVLAIGLVFWLRYTVNKTESGPTAPTPQSFAESSPTRGSDGADSKWISREFAGLTRMAPWLDAAGRSVFDACSVTGSGGSLVGGGSAGYTIQCNRTDTRYYTYGGPTTARIQRLERALSRMGWETFTSILATGGSAALPVVSASPPAGTPPAGKATLQISWAERGSQLDPGRDIGAVPPLAAPQRNTYLEVLRPSLKGILSRLSQAQPHVLVVALTATYADRTVPA